MALLGLTMGPTYADKLVIGVEKIQYQPIYWQNKKGDYTGYTRDVFDLFAQKYNHQIEYVSLEPHLLLGELFNGNIDFKYPDHPEWGSDIRQGKNIAYTDAIVRIADGSFVKPAKLGKGIETVTKLGVVQGFTPWMYQEFIDSGQVTVIEYENLKDLIRAAIRNKVDAALYNVVVATYYMDFLSTFPIVTLFDDTLPFVKSDFRMSTISKPNVVKEFNDFLQAETAAIDQLKQKYEVEKNIDSEYLGIEQWRINYLERSKN